MKQKKIIYIVSVIDFVLFSDSIVRERERERERDREREREIVHTKC